MDSKLIAAAANDARDNVKLLSGARASLKAQAGGAGTGTIGDEESEKTLSIVAEINAEMEHLDAEAKNELADIKAELETQENETEITPPAGAPLPIKVENGSVTLIAWGDVKENEKEENGWNRWTSKNKQCARID